MSVHIGAAPGQIAEAILLPGDPLRAKYIAEHFLEDVICYNEVRGMYGYTGRYRGTRISVQGTGMGMPSASIYIHELIQEYGVKQLIRVGTCGAIREDVHVRDLVLAQGASTTSSMMRNDFPMVDLTNIADFHLLQKAYQEAIDRNFTIHVGNILSEDCFYHDHQDVIQQLAKHGVLAVEMEAAALYYLAARYGVQALALMTVSDHIITGEETSAKERQTTFDEMVIVGLETAHAALNA